MAPGSLINGFPVACFPVVTGQDDDFARATALDNCAVQRLYARVIQWLYSADAASITTLFSNWFSSPFTLTIVPVAGVFPAIAIVVSGRFALCIASGTANFQQAALQGFFSLAGPVNFGASGTSPFWDAAATYSLGLLALAGVGAQTHVAFIGHSYGGALACVAAARLRAANPNQVLQLLTYGMPKPGDSRLVQLSRASGDTHIANEDDFVTVLPPSSADLAPLVLVFGPAILLVWPAWERAREPVILRPDGTTEQDWPLQMATSELQTAVSNALINNPLAPFAAHSIDAYFDRLKLRCAKPEWPIRPSMYAALEYS